MRNLRAATTVLGTLVIAAALAAGSQARAVTYSPVDLDLGAHGAGEILPNGVGDGEVVGFGTTPSATQAFVWDARAGATPLGQLTGFLTSEAHAVQRGVAVGQSTFFAPAAKGAGTRAVVWLADGSMVDLGAVGEASTGSGLSVAGDGTIVVVGYSGSVNPRLPSVWTVAPGGAYTVASIGLPDGSDATAVQLVHGPYAHPILLPPNLDGSNAVDGVYVAGYTVHPTAPATRPFVWRDGVLTSIPDLRSSRAGNPVEPGVASAVSDGLVAGFARTGLSGNRMRAFVYDIEGMTTTADITAGVPGIDESEARDTRGGYVVGELVTTGGTYVGFEAFIWSADTGVTKLPSLYPESVYYDGAWSVNRQGVVVGFSASPGTTDAAGHHATAWHQDDEGAWVAIDLQDALPGWTETAALQVDDAGYVLGTGRFQGSAGFTQWVLEPSDGDQCALGEDDCDPVATCTDTYPGWACDCPDGYRGDGTTCAQIDECDEGSDTCHADADCTDTPGSYTCACRDGYDGDGLACADVDECQDGLDDCALVADCDNVPGSFVCSCPDGYRGDGTACDQIDECDEGTDTCHDDAACVDTPGSFTCTCDAGYAGDGQDCDDVDECADDLDDCDVAATCDNLPGTFRCTCPTGWIGDGTACTKPVCLDVVCDSGEVCVDQAGVAVCDCETGLVPHPVGCAVAVCGDGLLGVGPEACDDGAANSDTVADACRADCTLAACGDGVKDTPEACDDGDVVGTDGCDPSCSVEAGWVCDPTCRPDRDEDGVADEDDVCPDVSDDQTDSDGDGVGDACEEPVDTGSVDTGPLDPGSCGCAHGGPRSLWLGLVVLVFARRRSAAGPLRGRRVHHG